MNDWYCSTGSWLSTWKHSSLADISVPVSGAEYKRATSSKNLRRYYGVAVSGLYGIDVTSYINIQHTHTDIQTERQTGARPRVRFVSIDHVRCRCSGAGCRRLEVLVGRVLVARHLHGGDVPFLGWRGWVEGQAGRCPGAAALPVASGRPAAAHDDDPGHDHHEHCDTANSDAKWHGAERLRSLLQCWLL